MKNIKILGFYLLFFALFLPAAAFSQGDKEAAYKQILDKYGNINSVSLDFVSRNLKDFKGSFQAKRGNKYIVNTNGRTIISDGKTVWNYSIKDKKVVISSIDDLSEGAVSLENFFFTVIKQFKPISLVRQSSSKSKNTMVLALEPKERSKAMSDLQQVKLYYDPVNLNLKAIEIKAGKNSQVIDVSNVRVNTNLADSQFIFSPPKGVEVIDLR